MPEGALLFPVRKDDTDLMLAIKKGIEMEYQDFLIYGATGGRLDHTIASIQSLSYLLSHGCRGILVDGEQWVTLIRMGQSGFQPVTGMCRSFPIPSGAGV